MRGSPTLWALVGFALGTVAFLLFGILKARLGSRLDDPSPRPFLETALLPTSWWVIVWMVVLTLVAAPGNDWNALAQTQFSGFGRGWPPYADSTTGPVTGYWYGPVPLWLYLPSSWFDHPETAIRVRVLLTLAWVWIPCGLAIRWMIPNPNRGVRFPSSHVMILIYWVLHETTPTRLLATMSAIDGPGLGWSALACGALARAIDTESTTHRRRGFEALAAFAAIAALGCKQSLVFVPIGLVVWAALVGSGHLARRLSLWLGLFASGFLVGTLSLATWEELRFNMIAIPGERPWSGATPFNLIQALTEWTGFTFPWLVAPLAFALAKWNTIEPGRWRSPATTLRQIARSSPWLLASALAVLGMPTAVMGRVIVGGDFNGMGPSVGLAMVSLSSWLVSQALSNESQAERPPNRSNFNPARAALGIALALLLSRRTLVLLTSIPRVLGAEEPAVTQAWKVLRAEPGTVRFPWHPLAHLLAEGRPRHADYPLYDCELIGQPLEPTRLRSDIPATVRFLALPSDREARFLDHRPEFQTYYLKTWRSWFPDEGAHPGLPGWRIHARAPVSREARAREADNAPDTLNTPAEATNRPNAASETAAP